MIPTIFPGMQVIAEGNPELEARIGAQIVPLPVARTTHGMLSCWRPNKDELDTLNKGGVVALTVCCDFQPPVMVEVIEIEQVRTN
jgi:hypothetical protein